MVACDTPVAPPDLVLELGDLFSRWGVDATTVALANLPQGFSRDPFFVSNRDLLFSLVVRGYGGPVAAVFGMMGPDAVTRTSA